jgi:hypothetical protein
LPSKPKKSGKGVNDRSVAAIHFTDKKENKSFLIYKEIKRDRVQSHI